MTICARNDGRPIKDCTRGIQGCICAREILEIAGRIAYPARESADEEMTLQDFADEIRANNQWSAFE